MQNNNPTYDNLIDAELLSQMKTLFAKGNANTIAEITKAVAVGDFKEAHRLVHTLKSSAQLIGKMQLSDIAKEAEGLFKAGSVLPQRLYCALETELQKVLDQQRETTGE